MDNKVCTVQQQQHSRVFRDKQDEPYLCQTSTSLRLVYCVHVYSPFILSKTYFNHSKQINNFCVIPKYSDNVLYIYLKSIGDSIY